jgi:hypothetical protein
MNWYYQLIKPKEKEKFVYNTARDNKLYPVLLNTKGCGTLLALEFNSPDFDKLKIFNEELKNVNIDYFLFTNNRFENLIKAAEEVGVNIKSIQTSKTNQEVIEKINELLLLKNYPELLKLIDEKNINIKNIELASEDNVLKLYDSGVFMTESKLIKSKKSNSLFRRVLDFACDAASCGLTCNNATFLKK